MAKAFICLILGALIASSQSISAQDQKTDVERDELIGPVQSVKTEKPNGSEVTIYSQNGAIIEKKAYNSSGDIQLDHVFYYDDAGKLKNSIEYDSNGQIFRERRYAFDAQSKKRVERSFDSQGASQSKFVHYYNDSGECTRFSSYKSDTSEDLLLEEVIYNRNENRNELETVVLSGNTILEKTVSIERENGRQVEITTLNKNGSIVGKIRAEKNITNTEIRINQHDRDDFLRKTTVITRVLDSYGNWILENKVLQDHKNGSKQNLGTINRSITYY